MEVVEETAGGVLNGREKERLTRGRRESSYQLRHRHQLGRALAGPWPLACSGGRRETRDTPPGARVSQEEETYIFLFLMSFSLFLNIYIHIYIIKINSKKMLP
jgi:hypothetical protein